ncbi:MAG: type I methionyl aminopeptidase [Pseudomonadota bacterium]
MISAPGLAPSRSEQSPLGRTPGGVKLHGPEGFAGMRVAGRLAAETLDMIGAHVRPGVSTGALDTLIHEFVLDHGATPATLGYRDYPKSSCISINHVVCHGIPGDKLLKSGDILNIDVTVIVEGWHGDSSRMYVAGRPTRKAERLIDVTHEALMRGIAAVTPGGRFGDIGRAIQSYVEAQRYSVVRDFCGHGLGQVFHDAPSVLHYLARDESGEPHWGERFEPGMFFTIEPMVNIGKPGTRILADKWTAVTRDKSLSAQFEHSIGVTEDGCEIFTLSPTDRFHPTWTKAR